MKTKKHLSLWGFFALLILVLGSCKKSEVRKSAQNDSAPEKANNQVIIPQAHPADMGEYVTYYMNDGSTVVLQKVNDEYILGGDIVLSANQLKYIQNHSSTKKLSAQSTVKEHSTFTSNFNLLWPGGKVYYTINNPVNQGTINAAISYWSSHTQLQFIQRTNQANYIVFSGAPAQGSGDSQLGMVGGPQQIRLINNVDFGGVLHEIGHAIGLMHEQARTDRGAYINVNYANINSNWRPQYDTYPGLSGYQIGLFDFDSIMLYPSDNPDARINGNTAFQMTKLDGTEFFQQRYYLSAGDIAGVNYLYFNSLFAKLRFVPLGDQIDNEYTAHHEYTVYVDFFQDAACTIPKTITSPIRLNITEGSLVYYDPYRPTETITNLNYNISPGVNSIQLYSDIITQEMGFTYDGTATPGSYIKSYGIAGGIGYIGRY